MRREGPPLDASIFIHYVYKPKIFFYNPCPCPRTTQKNSSSNILFFKIESSNIVFHQKIIFHLIYKLHHG